MSREDSGSLTKARQEELRTIKTEDIDVELSSKDTNRDHAIPGTKHIFALRLETNDTNLNFVRQALLCVVPSK